MNIRLKRCCLCVYYTHICASFSLFQLSGTSLGISLQFFVFIPTQFRPPNLINYHLCLLKGLIKEN
ncbi:hypothetical protein MtrunA17_Chr7g0235681 [Medicago truncatula]|uniref:Transmembrane protein n=1 Tax=Medicago truncatula TaxID=3880 RepID=A0A396GXG1_MEDTR|nr:hypothetical protein MtrunA17_Chr7g0235681 [Medicago truncatula]